MGSMLRTAWLACLAGRVAGEMYLTHNCDAAGCRCNVGFYAYVPGQADFTGCTKCPAHATTNGEGSAGLSDCVCRPGFTPPAGGLVSGGACVRCAVDTYKDTTSNDACTACPSDSTTLETFGAATRDICQCNADFEGDLSNPNVDCVQCESTHEKQNAGPETCVAIVDCAGEWEYPDVCTDICGSGSSVERPKTFKINTVAGPEGAACSNADGDTGVDICPANTVFRSDVDRWVTVQVLTGGNGGVDTVSVEIRVYSTDTNIDTGLGIHAPTVKIDGVEVPLASGVTGEMSFTAMREQTEQTPLVAISGLRSCAASGDIVHEMVGTGTKRILLPGADSRRR